MTYFQQSTKISSARSSGHTVHISMQAYLDETKSRSILGSTSQNTEKYFNYEFSLKCWLLLQGSIEISLPNHSGLYRKVKQSIADAFHLLVPADRMSRSNFLFSREPRALLWATMWGSRNTDKSGHINLVALPLLGATASSNCLAVSQTPYPETISTFAYDFAKVEIKKWDPRGFYNILRSSLACSE